MTSNAKPSEKMLAQICPGSIIYIKHKNTRGQDVYHYAIVCNLNPKADPEIVLAIITSDNRGADLVPRIRQKFGPSTVVSVPAVAFRKLNRLSFINCNLPVFRSLSKLCEEVDSEEASFYHPGINQLLRVELSIKGMLDSRLVSPEQKAYIMAKCKKES
ncbi:MAG: hypothetical protein IKO93_15025 [Lentisphaeria bacterium]|nr:hypothetical protein [Lentisphaeria bacterium]